MILIVGGVSVLLWVFWVWGLAVERVLSVVRRPAGSPGPYSSRP